MCNLVYFFKLADGFRDDWYLSERLADELKVPGVTQVRSWRTLDVEREPDPVMRPLNNYDRMTQVSFRSITDAEHALASPESLWTHGRRAGLDKFEGALVGSEPEYDLLRDAPAAQYPFMGLPIEWSQGRPPVVPEPKGPTLAKFIYFFGYRDDVDVAHAENWYFGHHTREGKQLPGIQRYVTWKRRPGSQMWKAVPELTTFMRFTELCFETVDTWIRVCYEEGPKWVRSPRYGEALWGNYKCFFIADTPDVDLSVDSSLLA